MEGTLRIENQAVSVPRSRFVWIRSPAWDLFFVFSGLWVIVLFGVAGVLFNRSIEAALITLAIGNLVFWAGHNLSPVMIAWSDSKLRSEMLKRPALFLGLPIGLTALAFLLELVSTLPHWTFRLVTPFGVFFPSYIFLLIYLVWNSWHFGSQHFGILSLYRRLSLSKDDSSRNWDAAYCRILFCVALPLGWFSQGVFLGPFLGLLPSHRGFSHLGEAVVVFTLVYLGVMLARDLRKPEISIPRLFYLILIAAQPVLAVLVNPIFHFALYTATHYMLAIALTSRILSYGDKNIFGIPGRVKVPGFERGSSVFHFFSLLLWSPLLYVIVFGHRPRLGMAPVHHYLIVLGHRYFESLAGLFTPHAMNPIWTCFLIGGYYGLALTHFFYDRFVYRFGKNREILAAIRE